jgi:hypothetical protein
LGAVCLIAGSGLAQVIPLTNAGFEAQTIGENGFVWGATSWVRQGAAGVFNPTASAYATQAPEGDNVAFLTCCTGPFPSSGNLSQTLATVYTADTMYTLATQSGTRLDDPLSILQYRFVGSWGSTVLGVKSFTTMPTRGTFRTDELTWDVFAGDAAVGRPITIRLQHVAGPGQINIDDVTLTGTPICVRIREQPADAQACPGLIAQLSARVGGTGPFTFTWEYESATNVWTALTNGGAGPSGGSSVIFQTSGGGLISTLKIVGFGPGDVKNYRLNVTTTCGDSEISDPATFEYCAVDYACDGFIDFNDLIAYVVAFEAGSPGADFDGNGFVDFFDLSDFFDAFDEGC